MNTALTISVPDFYKHKRIIELDKFRNADGFDITITFPNHPQISKSVESCSLVEAELKRVIINYKDFIFTVVPGTTKISLFEKDLSR